MDNDMDDIIIGRPLLLALEFDINNHLATVRTKFDNMDCSTMPKSSTLEPDTATIASMPTYQGIWYDKAEDDPIPIDNIDANIGIDREEDVQQAIESTVEHARQAGMSEKGLTDGRALLKEYRDILRIRLGPDPPANVYPFIIQLKPSYIPARAPQRRYAPRQNAFISSTIRQLEKVNAVYPNPKAKWASPALALPKPGTDKLRFTVDLRGPNKRTIPIVSAMPDMESLYQSPAGSSVYWKIDICHAFWQLPLHVDLQEIMSIQTPVGVY